MRSGASSAPEAFTPESDTPTAAAPGGATAVGVSGDGYGQAVVKNVDERVYDPVAFGSVKVHP